MECRQNHQTSVDCVSFEAGSDCWQSDVLASSMTILKRARGSLSSTFKFSFCPSSCKSRTFADFGWYVPSINCLNSCNPSCPRFCHRREY